MKRIEVIDEHENAFYRNCQKYLIYQYDPNIDL